MSSSINQQARRSKRQFDSLVGKVNELLLNPIYNGSSFTKDQIEHALQNATGRNDQERIDNAVDTLIFNKTIALSSAECNVKSPPSVNTTANTTVTADYENTKNTNSKSCQHMHQKIDSSIVSEQTDYGGAIIKTNNDTNEHSPQSIHNHPSQSTSYKTISTNNSKLDTTQTFDKSYTIVNNGVSSSNDNSKSLSPGLESSSGAAKHKSATIGSRCHRNTISTTTQHQVSTTSTSLKYPPSHDNNTSPAPFAPRSPNKGKGVGGRDNYRRFRLKEGAVDKGSVQKDECASTIDNDNDMLGRGQRSKRKVRDFKEEEEEGEDGSVNRLDENRNQLSSSLSTTKTSSQQFDTSSQSNDDVDINNTKQSPLSTQKVTTPPSSQKPDTSPEYTIYSMVEELQLPEQGTVQHSTLEDMIGFATKKKSELDPLELLMQPELHCILDLRNGKITLKQYEKEHKQWRIDLKTLIDCNGKYTANLGITALFVCDGVIIAYYATLNEIHYICPHEEVDINKVDTNNPSMQSILKDMPQAIIKEASGQWLSNFSVNSHRIRVIDCIPVCCELRKEEATVVELANDISTTPSKVKSVSAVLLSAAANYKLVKTEEALDVLFASKGAQEHLRFGCSSKQAKERSIIHKPSGNKLLNDHGWTVHGENLIGRLARRNLRNPIYTPALHKQIGVSIMNFLHAAWRHRPELLALIKSLKCTTFLLKKAGRLNLTPEEMEAAAETTRISIQRFVDNAAQARSAVATLKNNLGTDFDMDEALILLGEEEGCKPGVLSKLEFEHDCRDAMAKYVSDSAAARDMEEIFAEIKNEFGENVLDWLKSGVEQSMAKVEFDRLSAENPKKSTNDIIDELRKMTTTVNGSKVKLFTDGTLNWAKSTVEISYAKDKYNELVGNGKSSDDSIAILETSGEVSGGTISHLKSTVVERSKAKAEFDRLVGIGRSTDDAIDKLRKMTTTVNGSKVKLFTDGTISWVKSNIAEPSDVKAEYDRINAENIDIDHDAIIAKLKNSGKFSDGAINVVDGRAESGKKGNVSMAEARAAVADGNIKNASKKTQVIANHLDEGHKKKADTQRLKADIKTLKNGGDILEIQCNLCEDKRPVDSTGSSKKQVGKKYSFCNTKSSRGLACFCSKRHRDWDVSSSMTGPDIASALEDAEAQLAKSNASKTTDQKIRKKAIKKAEEEDVKAAANQPTTKSGVDTSKPPAKKATSNSSKKATKSKKKSSNTKSSVDNNKSTSSKSLGKRKASDDEVDEKKKKKHKKLVSSKGVKKAAPAKKSSNTKSSVGNNKSASTKKKDISKKVVSKKKSTKSKCVM